MDYMENNNEKVRTNELRFWFFYLTGYHKATLQEIETLSIAATNEKQRELKKAMQTNAQENLTTVCSRAKYNRKNTWKSGKTAEETLINLQEAMQGSY